MSLEEKRSGPTNSRRPTELSRQLTAPASNRLNAIADAVGATAETWDAEAGSFTYDANGNQLTAPVPYSITATKYDPRNLPDSITIGGTLTTYRYDDAGQRITKQVGAGSTEVYVREGTTTLGVFTVNAGGTVTSSYVNLLAGDRVIGRQPSVGSRSYYHTDLLGSTRSVVQGVTVTESYDADPWGLLMPGRTLGSGTKEGFTGKERDAESQMDYFGARYYLSALGRWGSVDPADAADQSPEWSTYSYLRDEPVGATDRNGMCKAGKDCWAAFLSAVRRFLDSPTGQLTFTVSAYMFMESAVDPGRLQGEVASAELMAERLALGSLRPTTAALKASTEAAAEAEAGFAQAAVSAKLPQDAAVGVVPPPSLPVVGRAIGRPSHNAALQEAIASLPFGARDVRLNQRQVNSRGQRVGVNRPDLQYTLNGKRYYVEFEGPTAPRALSHTARIVANDPGAIVKVHKVK